MNLGHILRLWPLVVPDLSELYGIDVYDRELMHSRPWPWLRQHLIGLLSSRQSRVRRVLLPDPKPQTPAMRRGHHTR